MKPAFQIRNRILLLADLILIFTSVVASFALRLDLGPLFIAYIPQALTMAVIALVVKPIVFYFFGLYRRYWAYASTRELQLIAVTTATASVLTALAIVLTILVGLLPATFPRSVFGIDWLLSLFSVGGLRMAVRVLAESGQVSEKADGLAGRRRVVVVGAGDAGALVVREMRRNPQLHMLPVAFVDDDEEKQDKEIHGVLVAGALKDLADVAERYRAQEVVIAIPSAPGPVVRFVTDTCRKQGISFRTMPGVYELIGGKVSVSRLREVDISDLLRREPAHMDDEAVGRTLTGKRVLVTGAGGSIGVELCRQIARWRPSELGLLGHGENSIFEALLELRADYGDLALVPIIADIRDIDRIRNVFEDFRPHVVFHTAAHKHVPLMEVNVEEAVTNNILGTQSVVEAALQVDAERLVMISTDKAVQPLSVMGATKRMAEAIVREAADRSGRSFGVVRFGNVLGSRGSIVPIFKRQIARGGPITITHPEMERYFMTVPEAVHLVLQAASMGNSGDTFVLRMGEQIRVVDLAKDLIRLSGLKPGEDIEIVYTGIRAGEKLSEKLWDEDLDYEPTEHPDIVQVEEDSHFTPDTLQATIDELVRLAREGDEVAIIGLLSERVPGSTISQTPPPDLTSVL
ncbi:MAG: nucleoside-diphosphate sugar epimerase/dehydratase [Anaerolineales bacterium]